MFDFLKKTKEGIKKTHEAWIGKLASVFDRAKFEEGLWDQLEELLIMADVGVNTTLQLLERVKDRTKKEKVVESASVQRILKEEMVRVLTGDSLAKGNSQPTAYQDSALATAPWVVMVVGVNGSGKTTSIAKLAHLYKSHGKKVILAAGDTFRAAAAEQLQLWGSRAGAEVVAHQAGADAGAVAFDALQAAKNRKADILVIDTAGRLHTKFNLMEELKKVKRVLARVDSTAPHEVLLVLDATTGQNGLAQAKNFADAVGVTGIFLAKLDGTAKGGIVLAISDELKIPIQYIGTGEKLEDVVPFDRQDFVEALF